MRWLETHAYLATWLALPIAVITGTIQNAKSNFEHIDWSRSLIYLTFLTALAATFTPTFDEKARTTAGILVFCGFFFLVTDRKPR